MQWKSAVAIYVLFWAFSVFLVLPFGVRTSEEAGAPLVPGQAPSAPHGFSPKRIAMRFGLKPCGALGAWPGTSGAPASSLVRTPKGSTRKTEKAQNST